MKLYKDLFFKVSAKLKGFPNNEEVQIEVVEIEYDNKEALLSKLLVGNPDTRANLGSVKVPPGFAIMRLEGHKNYIKEPIFYFVKYTGEHSELSNRKQVIQWAKANYAHHGE